MPRHQGTQHCYLINQLQGSRFTVPSRRIEPHLDERHRLPLETPRTTSSDRPNYFERPPSTPRNQLKMAGHHHSEPELALDPALVKLGHMQSNRHIFFRWTPRTARVTLMYAVVVPVIVGYIGYKTDGLWDLRAKRKGDLVYER
ncbi:hypothetical protein CDEST_01233 [Colletotrichum destructivum]|uniref:Uncharacterized protein n=1 Tax=Colletotrichum destructivum TaxID=34406 RepID=A0AAX4HYN1_9PEZI|nr:hypothetical protein CDEST_01233 [Colletotrichum destructivum]